jgi:hypothetical protein
VVVGESIPFETVPLERGRVAVETDVDVAPAVAGAVDPAATDSGGMTFCGDAAAGSAGAMEFCGADESAGCGVARAPEKPATAYATA